MIVSLAALSALALAGCLGPADAPAESAVAPAAAPEEAPPPPIPVEFEAYHNYHRGQGERVIDVPPNAAPAKARLWFEGPIACPSGCTIRLIDPTGETVLETTAPGVGGAVGGTANQVEMPARPLEQGAWRVLFTGEGVATGWVAVEPA